MKQNKIKLFPILIITLLLVSCSDSIVSECEPDTKVEDQMKASYKEIQDKVFTPTCATSGCHAGAFATFPNLQEGVSYNNIVGVDNQSANMPLVDPGNSANSYLYKKLLGNGTTLMPSGGQKLSQTILDSIRVWIDNGAENN